MGQHMHCMTEYPCRLVITTAVMYVHMALSLQYILNKLKSTSNIYVVPNGSK